MFAFLSCLTFWSLSACSLPIISFSTRLACLFVCLFVCFTCVSVCLLCLFAFVSCLTFFSPSFLASWSLSACSLPVTSFSTRHACLFVCLFHMCICLSLMSVCFCFISHLFLAFLPSQQVIECLQLAHDLLQHLSCLLVCLFVCFTCVSVCILCLFTFVSCLTFFSPSFLASWSLSACSLPMISFSTPFACLFVCLFVSLVYLSVYMSVCFCLMCNLFLPLLPSQLVIQCLQLAHDLPQHSFCLFVCLFVSLVYLPVSYVCLLLFHVSPFSPLPSYPAGHWVPAACPWSPSALVLLACLLACLSVCLFVSLVYLSVNMSVCFCFMSHLFLPFLPIQLVIECLQLAHDLLQHSFCLLTCLFVCFTCESDCLYVCLFLSHVSPSSPPPS